MGKSVFLAIVLLLLLGQCRMISQSHWQVQFSSLPSFAYTTEMVFPNDGSNRIFIVQQRGIIYVIKNEPDVSARKVFLDISDRVSQSGSETGLLGLAFHPNYKDSNYIYVNYTSSGSGSLRSYIARYAVSPNNIDSAVQQSEKILLTVDQPYSNHNGGKLAFGPDGYLYIGFGDGGSANDPQNRAQNLGILLGKILRINVDNADSGLSYSIPKENPFYRNSIGAREEIYAYGIRNPWKFSFDRVTGKLWLGDVGQDRREEIDIVVNGGNYGWRLKEGFICNVDVNPTCQDTEGLLSPIWDYSHNGLSASITGGYVYRSSELPQYYGKYIYGDYVTGETWALTYDSVHPVSSELISKESFLISTFGQDTIGNVYCCSYANNGRIYKLAEGASGSVTANSPLPYENHLFQNYPNPFNPSTIIPFTLSQRSEISLEIFDLLGRRISTLIDGFQEPGKYEIPLSGINLGSGIYFYRLQAGNYSETKKLIFLK